MSQSDTVVVISECFVRPKSEVQHSEKHHYISPLALKLLSLGNTQYGLLFNTTSLSSNNNNSNLFFDILKLSLSHALVYFYPLAGRLVTQTCDDDPHSCSIFVDCHKGPGARLVHASALDVSVADVVSRDADVPLAVQSFFDLGSRQVNHDGHTRALLSVQLTELVDGLFIGCCINHCVADGTSLSHFLNILSQIFLLVLNNTTSDDDKINLSLHSVPAIKPPASLNEAFKNLKLRQVDQFITRFHEDQLLRDRVFHFSAASMSKLKAEANYAEASTKAITLSSFKALCGLVWKAIARARNLPYNETTTIALAVNIRSRLDPPLPPTHFADCFVAATASAKAGELITKELGWATMLIHESVNRVDHKGALGVSPDKSNINISDGVGVIVEEPGFGSLGPNPVVMGGSPWFDFQGVDFGVGKPVAVRTGYTNRADGKLTAFPGLRGAGTVDLQVGLLPHNMCALLLDKEFMSYVS